MTARRGRREENVSEAPIRLEPTAPSCTHYDLEDRHQLEIEAAAPKSLARGSEDSCRGHGSPPLPTCGRRRHLSSRRSPYRHYEVSYISALLCCSREVGDGD